MKSPAEIELANTLWGTLFAEELARLGCRLVCVAPGSRSTPLVAGVARNPKLEAVVIGDERGAAYFALGHARASGRPAVLLTTSGTAAANAYPALLEAEAEQLPLFVVSADRPPEARTSGDNQCIDQVGLFGSHVRAFAELPCPDDGATAELLLSTLDTLFHAALGANPGPVHLNMMFRKPLGPAPSERQPAVPPALTGWSERLTPLCETLTARRRFDGDALAPLVRRLRGVERGLLVVGGLRGESERAAAGRLAAFLGWPAIVDVTGGSADVKLSNSVGHADLLLHSEDFAAWAAQADGVVRVGGRVVSARVEGLLGRVRGEGVQVSDRSRRVDPTRSARLHVEASLEDFVASLSDVGEGTATEAGASWLEGWRRASAAASRGVARVLDSERGPERRLSGVLGLRMLLACRAGEPWVVSNSMPVRLCDWLAGDGVGETFANRGVSGIEGLMATACGVAHARRAPLTLVIGDQAFLHDLSSLQLLARSGQAVRVVLINNGGGAIFGQLPIAAHADLFDKYFTSPQTWEFGPLAAGFRLDYRGVDDVGGLADVLAGPRGERPSILEVRTRRATEAEDEGALVRAVVGELAKAEW